MITRRTAIKYSSLSVAALATGIPFSQRSFSLNTFPNVRPPLKQRKFISDAVEAAIQNVSGSIDDDELRWLFGNCYPNTLDTTVETGTRNNKPDTFVITGDIHAMWLRDSSAQVWPYIPLTKEDKQLQSMIAGVIHRQSYCITIDPYANAFNKAKEGSYWEKDLTEMKKELHERKWEIDSLCYPIRLAYGYWKTTGDTSVFDAEWRQAMQLVLKTFREQQRMNVLGPYKFQRETHVAYDTVPFGGYGNPTKKIGLIHSMFRPSDDACIFPYLIPSNYFAVVSLKQLSEITSSGVNDTALAKESRELAEEIESVLKRYAVHDHLRYGKIFAYEIDGYGNAFFMDDANVPSLLSMPYLHACDGSDPVYQNTRRFLLSNDNPYFYKGSAAEGIGGPHVGTDMIWHLGITMRALTSSDDDEIRSCLTMLKATHAGTGFMHESFHKNDPKNFTRGWFAWANTLFGELIVKIHSERPHILKGTL
ncbi:MAG: glycoside hydrolase family 125 protein [Ignavibacteriales bacterium]|nr:glycoside hydrolase family 125 protein [Ignavibacteriales bacterium]